MKKSNTIKKLMYIACMLVFITVLCTGCKKENKEEGTTTVSPAVTEAATAAPTAAATEAPKTGLTAGIYGDKFTPEGRGEYVGYFHFYDNGIFYFSMFNDKMVAVGTYEMIDLDKPMEFDGDDKDATQVVKGTTSKAIRLTNLDGTEYATLAYDEKTDTIYDVNTYYGHDFEHDVNTTHKSEDETGTNIAEYKIPDDDYSTVSIKHNGTYQDTISAMVEGTWAKEGDVYTLTNKDTQKSYTLTVSSDGKTAKYVGEDGTTMDLASTMSSTVLYTLKGSAKNTAGDADLGVTLSLFDDGKVKGSYAMGSTTLAGNGTWVENADKSLKVTVNGKDYTATKKGDVYNMDFALNDGTKDVTIPLTSVK